MTELDEMGKLVDINTMIDKWTDPYFGRGRGGGGAGCWLGGFVISAGRVVRLGCGVGWVLGI